MKLPMRDFFRQAASMVGQNSTPDRSDELEERMLGLEHK